MDLKLVMDLFEKSHWWGAAAAVVMISIRQFRRPAVQDLLPLAWRWISWPKWVQMVMVGVLSVLTTIVAALGSGTPVLGALLTAAPTMLTAIFGHKTTKAAGHALQDIAETQVSPLAYRPGSIRVKMDTLGLLPLDHHRLSKIHPPIN